jgi:hypothetical protein
MLSRFGMAVLVALGLSGCPAKKPSCQVHHGGCDPLATCTVVGNRTVCGDCPPGYTGTGDTTCRSACLTQHGGCDALTTCSVGSAGVVCGSCPSGYSGSGETGCSDIDECAVGGGPCGAGKQCVNETGSYRCLAVCEGGQIPQESTCLTKESVTIAGVAYTAVHDPEQIFRVVCQEPCTLSDDVLTAQYRGFASARSVLLPVTGVDLPASSVPFDLHIQGDAWCGPHQAGGFAGWSGTYWDQLGPPGLMGVGSYACLFLPENGHDMSPAAVERQDQQMLQIHEFVHCLFYKRHFASYEDFAYALSFYVSGSPPVTDPCSPQLDFLGYGRLVYSLCMEHGFQYPDLAPALQQLADLYDHGLGVYGEWTTVFQFRTILEAILGSDTSQTFLDLGYPPVMVGDRATVSSVGGHYAMVHGWVVLDVEPAALATDTVVRIDPVYSSPNSPHLSFDAIYNLWPEGDSGSPYAYTPLGAPMTLTLRYSPAMLAPGVNEADLRLLRISPDGARWEVVPGSSVDTTSREVTGTVSALGIYAVMPPG